MRMNALILFAVLFCASTAFSSKLAPLEVAQGPKVEGEYIVLFSTSLRENGFKDAISSMVERLRSLGDKSMLVETFVIGDTFKAAHVVLSYPGLLSVMTHPLVRLVSENGVVTVGQEPACQEQKDVIWNLDRINTRAIDLVDDNYHYSWAGEGVDSYVIDTGVQTTHVEFGGRAEWGDNFSGDGEDRDCNGHGTHVAGTIAGELYGVAKKTNVIAVKVLACSGSGTNAGVIAGVQYTVNQAISRKRPSVANMSLGGGRSTPVNEAVNAAVKQGVTMVVAAGNSRADACNFSPAAADLALTVASTEIAGVDSSEEQEDRRSSFSNFGECVDIAAPGSLIKAAWIDKEGIAPDNVYNVISGTSMASPHVAGVAALLLSAQPELTPADVAVRLVADANLGMVDFACAGNEACEKTPNVLLHTNTCA